MKRKFQLQLLMLMITASFIGLSSCEKDDDDNTAKTKTELLTTGSWKRTALISNTAYDWYGDGTFATDVLSAMKPCEKDNLDTYRNNGTGDVNEGTTKCAPTDPQTWTFNWAFANNETKIVFDGFDEYILVELTATTLKLRSTFVENGVSYTHDESYGH